MGCQNFYGINPIASTLVQAACQFDIEDRLTPVAVRLQWRMV